MICLKCNGQMAKTTRYKLRMVQYLDGERQVKTWSYQCLDCGKMRNEEHEDVPGGFSIGWDVIEQIVLMRKDGMIARKISQELMTRYGVALKMNAILGYIHRFGRGTL